MYYRNVVIICIIVIIILVYLFLKTSNANINLKKSLYENKSKKDDEISHQDSIITTLLDHVLQHTEKYKKKCKRVDECNHEIECNCENTKGAVNHQSLTNHKMRCPLYRKLNPTFTDEKILKNEGF